jgi:uncharacterized lipoprotein YddW (UPF0748 family)
MKHRVKKIAHKFISALLAPALLCSVPIGFGGVAQAEVDASVYPLTRQTPVTSESITRDFIQARSLFDSVGTRLREALAAWRDAPLGRAEIDYTIAQLALINAEVLINSRDLEAAARDLDIVSQRLRSAQLALSTSRPVEMRGMYIDVGAMPKTREGIAKMLDELKSGGFNTLFPEVFRRGYTLYPNSQYTDQDPDMRNIGFDPLWELVREAQKRDLKIIPWIWTFRVRSPGYGNPILDRVPAYASSPADMEEWSKATPRFISPASPEGRDYIFKLVQELMAKYPFEGLLLDYIRYDELILEDAISATRFRQEYYKKNGKYPPLKIAKGTPLFQEWQLWREEQVNGFVQELKKRLRGFRQQPVMLGGAVFRSESYTRSTKMQNWRHWSNNSWIDFVSSMLYTTDKKDLHMWLDWETDQGKRRDLLYTVLGAHRFQSPDDIFGQIGVLQDRHVGGIAIFALSHYKKDNLKDLREGPFRKPAVLPHESLPEDLRLLTLDAARWLQRVASDPSAPAPEALRTLSGDLQNVAIQYQRLKQDAPLTALYSPINTLQGQVVKLHQEGLIPFPLRKEIESKLGYARYLIEIEEQRRLGRSRYTPSTLPPVVVFPEARKIPSIVVPRTQQAPTIDGNLEDNGWSQAAELKIKYWFNGVAEAGLDTTVNLTYDHHYLYVAYHNEEMNMDKLTSAATEWDDKRIFAADDAIEVMLAPGNQPENYLHYVLNAMNIRYDARKNDATWNGGWKSSVQRHGEHWDVEIAIPFSDLGIQPQMGTTLSANFFRNRYQDVTPYSAWSVPFGTYHTPNRFGKLILR